MKYALVAVVLTVASAAIASTPRERSSAWCYRNYDGKKLEQCIAAIKCGTYGCIMPEIGR